VPVNSADDPDTIVIPVYMREITYGFWMFIFNIMLHLYYCITYCYVTYYL